MSQTSRGPVLEPGQLVVVPAHPELGLGRLAILLSPATVSEANPAPVTEGRVFFYAPGLFLQLDVAELAPAPPGTWPPTPPAANDRNS